MSQNIQNVKGLPAKVRSYMKGKVTRIWMVLLALLVPFIATAPAAAVSFCTTDIDEMFDVVNNHILPKAGETVGAIPSLIIPLAFLVVLIMIVFFIPDLLYSMLDTIKNAIHRGGKR